MLPNGLTLLIEHIPFAYSASMGVWVRAGSKHDDAGREGLAHLVEHVLFRGTRTRSSEQIVRELESLGGDLDAFTERELTAFTAKVLSADLPMAIDLLFDLVVNPSFDDEAVEKEKAVIRREMGLHEEVPEARVQDLFADVLFGGHPLGRPIFGAPESLDRFTAAQAREFFERHYGAANMIVSLSGNFEPRAVLEELTARFGALDGGGGRPSRLPPPSIRPREVIVQAPVDQMYFCIGTEGLTRNDDDRVAMYTLSSLFGEKMSSRLYQRIREREAMVYSIYSYYNLYEESGSFAAYASVSPASFRRVQSMIAAEMGDLVENPVGERELELARAKLKGNLLFNMEHTERRMVRILKEWEWNGRYFTIGELLEMISAVSAADVRRVAGRLFRPQATAVAALSPDGAQIGKGVERP